MIHGHPVVDADSHKCENPVVFLEYLPSGLRDRIGFVRDRYGEQRLRIVDRNPPTGDEDLVRIFLQPEGYGKGTYRPYHPETTIGGLFNRVRIEHMDREGIDHQVIYGSVPLAFNSLMDPELAIALCRAYNRYIHDDCGPFADRLHPAAMLPLQAPDEAIRGMRRCVLELGMPAVCLPPNVPQPHPDAPDRFPEIRVPKHLSHPDFHPLHAEAQRLGIGLGIHGAPGFQLAGGTSDQLDSFTLVHVFANRSMQQMALARLIFDGVMEAFPDLRFGFLEAGAGWLLEFMHNLHEHWEKRIRRFDPSVEPGVGEFLVEFAREPNAQGKRAVLTKARGLMRMLFTESAERASAEELEAFRYEHPKLERGPLEYLQRGQIFLSVEPDDPSAAWLPAAPGETGKRICGLAVDYGHWDATLVDCVERIAQNPAIDADHAVRLLSANALTFYGRRLAERIATHPVEAAEPRRAIL
jgi:predicted TIM-barrel fold metal-dependent hydrolase